MIDQPDSTVLGRSWRPLLELRPWRAGRLDVDRREVHDVGFDTLDQPVVEPGVIEFLAVGILAGRVSPVTDNEPFRVIVG